MFTMLAAVSPVLMTPSTSLSHTSLTALPSSLVFLLQSPPLPSALLTRPTARIKLIIRQVHSKTTKRSHLIPGRMAIFRKNTDNWCWRGYGVKGSDLVQTPWKRVWRFLKKKKKGKIELPHIQSLHVSACPTLCDPMDCSLRGSFAHEILQARILEWVAMPFSMGSSQTRDWTSFSCISCNAGRFFTHWATLGAYSFHTTQLFYSWYMYMNKNKRNNSKRYTHPNVHSSITYGCQNSEVT